MRNKSSASWAPFSDAAKLILTGSDSLPLSPEQRTYFLNFISKFGTGENGQRIASPFLPGVRTQERVVDKGEAETLYYIPDFARYMLSLNIGGDFFNPPLDLDYLNNLLHEDGSSAGFLFSNAPAVKAWEQSEAGQAYWDLVCKKLELERDLQSVQRMPHENDPLKWEARARIEKELFSSLEMLKSEMAKLEECGSQIQTNSAKLRSIEPDWKMLARQKGLECKAKHSNLSLEQISEKVYVWMKEENIRGRGGKIPSAPSIARHALQNLTRKIPR